ncbi:MAG TPA: deoxyguanosinetriphosphate triphosphohydrolase [Xanthobacteraceae bacterium]|nr:deoxyguanosinetriphosphate triphosphohydrolase [Xanthobacteraceae bacterium]
MAVASLPRAPWAADPARSRGRLHGEEASPTRSDFRRDCDRLIHSTAFRRLKHKTQVFVSHEGDHFRTRLTHTLEVAQIARALARSLGLDEDLAEALALAHDLGHPPFGHAGEHTLDQCMAEFGGFDHNAQTLRVVTSLEHRYAGFDGLNLTFETLEGIAKHNGPLTDRAGKPTGRYAKGLPSALAGYAARHDLMLWSYPSGEAQAAAIADDIAYDAHDLDDALRAELFAVEDLRALPVAGAILAEVNVRYGEIDRPRLVNEITRRLIHAMIEDVVAETGRRVSALGIASIDDVRGAAHAVVGFSPAMQKADTAIKGFLTPRMYRNERVLAIMRDAQAVVRDLFARFSTHPEDLPSEWEKALGSDPAARARRIADFIAGMTDNFALEQHARFFDLTPKLR